MSNVRDVSAAVFGNKYRLEVIAAIASAPGDVYARELAVEIGVPDNLVTPSLTKLEHAGYIERLPRPRPNDPQYYRNVNPESAIWAMALALVSEVAAEEREPAGSRWPLSAEEKDKYV